MSSKPRFVGEKVKLGDTAEYIRGVTYKAGSDLNPTLKDGFVTLLRANNIQNGKLCFDDVQFVDKKKVKEKQLLRAGDILICASSGSKSLVGKAAYVPEDMEVTFGAFCCVIRPKSIDARYLSSYFQSRSYRSAIESVSSGSNINNLKAGDFRELNIRRYGEEERAIAERFALVNSLIDTCNSQLKLFDELVKSRFVEMFGDPVINPKGWSTQNLKALGELKNGVNFKSVDNGFEIKCLGVSDFKDRYAIKDMSLISDISLSGKPNVNQLLQDGDVVFVRSNGNKALVGRCLAIFPGEKKVTFSGFCIRFRNTSEELELDYLLNCLKTDSMRKVMTGRGANIQNLSQGLLSKVEIPLPPLELQQEFAAFASQVDKSRFIAQQQIEKLQMLYDSLAQDYFGD